MKTKVLLDAINSVFPGTTKKGLLPGSNMIIISNGEFSTFNDRISVSAYVDDPGLNIVCAVDAHNLKDVVKGIKEEEIDLSIGDHILSIVSENTEAELNVTSDIETILSMLDKLGINDLKFTDLPKDFNTGIALTKFNISDDYSCRNNLFCLQIKDGIIYTADNNRCSRYKMAGGTGHTVLIPKNSIDDLVSFNPTGMATTPGWAHFINDDDLIFSCNTVVGEYPVTENLFLVPESTVVHLPEELKEILEDITSLYDESLASHKGIKIEIKEGFMYCEIEKEKIWVKKKIKMPEDNPPEVSFHLSSIFLLEILDHTKEILVSDTKAVFQTDVYTHVLLLQI